MQHENAPSMLDSAFSFTVRHRGSISVMRVAAYFRGMLRSDLFPVWDQPMPPRMAPATRATRARMQYRYLPRG